MVTIRIKGGLGNQLFQYAAGYGVVIGYAIGFVFQAARSNLVKVYYAFQDSKTPMINGMLAITFKNRCST